MSAAGAAAAAPGGPHRGPAAARRSDRGRAAGAGPAAGRGARWCWRSRSRTAAAGRAPETWIWRSYRSSSEMAATRRDSVPEVSSTRRSVTTSLRAFQRPTRRISPSIEIETTAAATSAPAQRTTEGTGAPANSKAAPPNRTTARAERRKGRSSTTPCSRVTRWIRSWEETSRSARAMDWGDSPGPGRVLHRPATRVSRRRLNRATPGALLTVSNPDSGGDGGPGRDRDVSLRDRDSDPPG